MNKYKDYQKQRYIFFWLAIVFYFLPMIVATASLLPFMKAATGTKLGIGACVVLINSVPFLEGLLRRFVAKGLVVNWFSVLFMSLSGFFLLPIFETYVSTFCIIEASALGGFILYDIFWMLHLKYKRQAQTVKTVIKSGIVGGQ